MSAGPQGSCNYARHLPWLFVANKATRGWVPVGVGYSDLGLVGECRISEEDAYLLVVDTQIWGSLRRAKVSLGPPKHAAQEGAAGATQPAASKISAAVRPLQPATGSV